MYDKTRKDLEEEMDAINFLLGFLNLLEEFDVHKVSENVFARLVSEMNKVLASIKEEKN